MRLKINNIGKISNADIEFNGITVVAGENNTGKSTISKVLYSIFNSNYHSEEYIAKQKIDRVNWTVFNALRTHSSNSYDHVFRINRNKSFMQFIEKLLSYNGNDDGLLSEIKNFVTEKTNDTDFRIRESNVDEIVDTIFTSVKEIQEISNKAYLTTRIYNYFRDLFNEQIINIKSNEASATLTIKGEIFSITFSERKCTFDANFLFTNKAIFIDSPQAMDIYSSYRGRNAFFDSDPAISPKSYIASLLEENLHDVSGDDVVGKTISEPKVDRVMNVISKAVRGYFEDNSGNQGFHFSDGDGSIYLENLSSGVKSFLIIRKLLENGQINDRDVLILDEPEINLHPAWQVIFAELIVILQKEFNLTVLLSTHSPYFLSALEAYSKKYQVVDKCKYYLSETDGSSTTFLDVTDNPEKIYTKLAKPFDSISMIESEM
ncbi:MAG: ATP-binding protein [Oscillospiraceae bacterium]|nr:ATP-binding protein [Oscillospiraceae bacterium]